MFNAAFKYYGLNAIYKSFSVDDIGKAFEAARTLKFSGFAITMPFKKEAIQYLDSGSDEVIPIGAINTVVNINGYLKGFNTDYLAAKTILSTHDLNKHLYILGSGGYSAAVEYAAKTLNLNYDIIFRSNWNDIKDIKDSIIYNCTPVDDIKVDKSNKFIDCLISTDSGKKLSQIQAAHQFKLYTGLNFPNYEKM